MRTRIISVCARMRIREATDANGASSCAAKRRRGVAKRFGVPCIGRFGSGARCRERASGSRRGERRRAEAEFRRAHSVWPSCLRACRDRPATPMRPTRYASPACQPSPRLFCTDT
ncbi:hypothetical protein EGY19_25575 [Burkholderia multivorans]|nr:hypothetical protein EGY19_25575 [Burkholderia multivorans]PRF47481.1 hypothetical protein C6Q04_17220 [Burkholderia multivorans]PRG52889.1 hypothetical protein C6T63_11495 [Burkholderia multivorans]